MSEDQRPYPHPDAQTAPYWSGTLEDALMLPHCRACGEWHFYPRSACPACGSRDLDWQKAEGRGTVYSFSIVHRAPAPAFADEVPYVIAVVQLDEGPLMMSRVVECPLEAVTIGMRVQARYQPAGEHAKLPVFAPEVAP